jgi:multidrug resistance efflux pump
MGRLRGPLRPQPERRRAPARGGQITARHFRDGDIVQKGQLLFTIDQRPYRAALAEASANVASARSALALARSIWRARAAFRATRRFRQARSIAARPPSGRRGRAGRAEARERARALDMEFTQVRAPISGRISDGGSMWAIWSFGRGRQCHAAHHDQRARSDLFHLRFLRSPVPQAQRDRAAGNASAEVEIKLQDEPDYRHHGAWISPTTGSTRIRARSAAARCWPTPACS